MQFYIQLRSKNKIKLYYTILHDLICNIFHIIICLFSQKRGPNCEEGGVPWTQCLGCKQSELFVRKTKNEAEVDTNYENPLISMKIILISSS